MKVFILLSVYVLLASTRSITITNPNSGTYYTGTRLFVNWTSVDLIPESPIRIEMWHTTSILNLWTDEKIESISTTNTGSYELFIPLSASNDDDYFVKVISVGEEDVNDTSGKFTVQKGDFTLTISAPATAATTGEATTVAWQRTGVADGERVNIRLYRQAENWIWIDQNEFQYNVAWNVLVDGDELTWTVRLNNFGYDDYYLEVEWVAAAYRAKSSLFSIYKGTKSLEVLQPHSDSVWRASGTLKTVAFSYTGFDDADAAFDIELRPSVFSAPFVDWTYPLQLATATRDTLVYVALPDDANLTSCNVIVDVLLASNHELVASSGSFELITGENATLPGQYAGSTESAGEFASGGERRRASSSRCWCTLILSILLIITISFK